MRRLHLRRLLGGRGTGSVVALCWSLAIAGCKQGAGTSATSPVPPGGDGNVSQPIPLESACTTYVEDLCLALVTCGNSQYKTIEQCRADRDCLGMADLEQEIAAGWTEYSPEGAGRCHAMLRANPCEFAVRFSSVPALPAVLAICPNTLTGRRAVGESCLGDQDCVVGAGCLDMGCRGVCKRRLQLGEGRCNIDDEFCDQRADLECRSGACKKSARKIGDACEDNSSCHGLGLWCDQTVMACAPARGQGQPCNSLGAYCIKGLHCAADIGDDGICQPPSSIGQSCYTPYDCAEGLACFAMNSGSFTGTCRPAGPLPKPGEPCGGVSASDCAPNSDCVGEICRSRRYLGESCDDISLCQGSRCRDGMCAARAQIGGACETSDDCRSKLCLDGACREFRVCWGV